MTEPTTQEQWYQRESHKAFVIADDSLNIQLRSFVKDHDHRLLGDGEVTHDGRDTGHEGPLRLVLDGRDLSIKQGHFGSLHDVVSVITLCRLQEEERFDIAQDGEPERGSRAGVETSKRWRGPETAVVELNVQVAWASHRCQFRWSRWGLR